MMIQRFLYLIILLIACAGFPAHAASLRGIETAGILTNAEQGQLTSNVWSGLNRPEVLTIINALPAKYASPIYYELARRLLLSDASAVPEGHLGKQDPKAAPVAPSDPNRPDILIARLDKLLEMGALRDAEALYDTVITDIPPDFDLVYRNLQILMLRGQLSAACLDLQAMQPQHGGNPAWQELNRLCRIQFAQGGERARLLSETKFQIFPRLGDFLRGRNLSNLGKLSTEDLAFAVATNLIGDSSVRQLSPRAGNLPPLLLSVLYQMDTQQAMPEKMCLAIEAARRGIAGTRDLITLYEKPHYDSALLLDNAGATPSLNVHPCMIPSVLYQRVASNKTQPAHDRALRLMFDVMRELPDAALWPMAVYMRDMDVRASVNKNYLWRASRVLAYEKDELPAAWAQGWGGPGGRGVSPFWPIQAIVSPVTESPEDLALWRAQWPSEAKRVDSRDPSIPLLLGQSLAVSEAETSEKPKNKLIDYDNISSLTFSRSYAIPSYGLTQRLADVIKNNQPGQAVALLLIGYGAIPPDQVTPHHMALVIEGLNKGGLGRYARRFALEVLQ